MFKLQSSLKFSPFNAVYLLRLFFHYSKWFWTHQFWWLLVILPFFVSPLLHWQNVSLWGLFSSGKKKKVAQNEIRWIRRVGHRVLLFCVKNCLTLSTVWAGMLINHPSWNGQMHWVLKNFTKDKCSLSQHHQLVHWSRWAPRTLTQWGEACTTRVLPSEDNSILGRDPPSYRCGQNLSDQWNDVSTKHPASSALKGWGWTKEENPLFRNLIKFIACSTAFVSCSSLEFLTSQEIIKILLKKYFCFGKKLMNYT